MLHLERKVGERVIVTTLRFEYVLEVIDFNPELRTVTMIVTGDGFGERITAGIKHWAKTCDGLLCVRFGAMRGDECRIIFHADTHVRINREEIDKAIRTRTGVVRRPKALYTKLERRYRETQNNQADDGTDQSHPAAPNELARAPGQSAGGAENAA